MREEEVFAVQYEEPIDVLTATLADDPLERETVSAAFADLRDAVEELNWELERILELEGIRELENIRDAFFELNNVQEAEQAGNEELKPGDTELLDGYLHSFMKGGC